MLREWKQNQMKTIFKKAIAKFFALCATKIGENYVNQASDSVKTHEFVLTIMPHVLSSQPTLQLTYT